MKTILTIILILQISTAAWALDSGGGLSTPAVSSNQDQLIDKVMIVSGLNRSLRRFPAQIESGLIQTILRAGANEAEQQQVVKSLAKAIPQSAFVNNVSAALRRNFDEKRYAHLIQLLSGPVPKKMVELEANDPNPAEIQSFFAEIAKHPLSPDRIILIQRIDAASKAGVLLTKMTIASFEAGALAMGGDCSDAITNVRKMIAKKLPDIEKANHKTVQMMLAFSYRDVSDSDLDKYASIYEDADSKWVQGIVVGAIEEQFKVSMEQGTHVIKNIIQAHKPKKTMFAPKCGQSESPNKGEPDKVRGFEKEVRSHTDATEYRVSTPPINAGTEEVKIAALERNLASHQKAARKSERSTSTRKDLRACLDLPTSAEIIACTEK